MTRVSHKSCSRGRKIMLSAKEAKSISDASKHDELIETTLVRLESEIQKVAEQGLCIASIRLPYDLSQHTEKDYRQAEPNYAGQKLIKRLEDAGYEVNWKSCYEERQFVDIYVVLEAFW